MRKKAIIYICILLVFTLLTPMPIKANETRANYAHPSTNGKLHVEGTQLVDQNNQPVQLKGLSTHGLAWFPGYVNDSLFHEFRYDWNANVIRLALYPAEYNGYCEGGNQNELKTLVKNGIQYAINNDLYVIVD